MSTLFLGGAGFHPAAGFQPAFAGHENSPAARRSRLKAAAGKIARNKMQNRKVSGIWR
ncbi:exported hypothetical protein [Candidatus Sulfopaludibacter sp. SbA4]|nr:exported hypothetical protein [Candidatus Sulfopaludibacter sp. SbA4]